MKIKVKKNKKNKEPIEVFINTPFIKLDQALKFSGIAETGGHAKEIVLEGAVYVNDEICLTRGKKIVPNDIIKVDDVSIIIKLK